MDSNINLTNYLRDTNVLKSKSIIDAFYKIDRKDFIIEEYKNFAYIDRPLGIGYGQTISQPTTVAFMLELLNPKKGDKILDIGSGSGWTTALLSHITGPQGYVLGLERINDLAIFGKQNMDKYKLNNVHIEKAGINLGITGKQFDKILVSASGDNIPNELIEQLVVGGVMVIPIQNSIYKIVKISSNNYFKEEYPNFVFVPLIKDR